MTSDLSHFGADILKETEKSVRAQEKCGFKYHSTNVDKPWPLMGDIRTEIITCINKNEWLDQVSPDE